MLEITCATLERLGLWDTRKCCGECHARPNPDLEMEYPGDGGLEPFHVSICCQTDGVTAFTDKVLRQLASEEASARRGRGGAGAPRLVLLDGGHSTPPG